MSRKKSRRERLKAGLGARTEASYSAREDSGTFKNIFKDDLSFPIWKPKDGGHSIDILPYFAGKNDPRVKEGEPTYFLDVWVHGHIGPTNDSVVCLQRNHGFGGKCPVCEEIAKLQQDPHFDYKTNERYQEIRPKRRSIYFVLVQDNIEELEKGPQIFDGAYSQFEKQFSTLAKTPKTARGTSVGGFVAFSSPDKDEGVTIYFERENKGFDVSGYKFLPREEDVPDEVLDNLTPLDETIHIPTYQELREKLFTGPVSPQEEEKEIEMDELPWDDKEETSDEEEGPSDCPNGGRFGHDIENEELDCDNCDLYDKCAEESSRIMRERKEKRRIDEKRRGRRR